MEKKNIYQAIADIMNEVEAIGKTKKNPMQGFMYRSIDDMYNDLQPKFAKHKVFITSEVLESKREERATAKGGLLIYTILRIRFTFYAEDGSNISSVTEGEAMDSSDKSTNKAMSVALKYCLMQLLLIPTEDLKKNDTDAHSPEPAPKAINNEVQTEVHKSHDVTDKPWLNKGTKEYEGAIKKLQSGSTTIEKIETVFKLSKAIRQDLLNAKNGVQHAN